MVVWMTDNWFLVALAGPIGFMVATWGGILGLSLANAVFVDQMIEDNNDALEAKVDRLTAEIRSLREEVRRDT
jgi:voltage-gated sodium channel